LRAVGGRWLEAGLTHAAVRRAGRVVGVCQHTGLLAVGTITGAAVLCNRIKRTDAPSHGDPPTICR